MKKESTGMNRKENNIEKEMSGFAAVREAVAWIVLTAAFLIPAISLYMEEPPEVPVISLVSNNYTIAQGEIVSELSLHAAGAVLMDAETGRVLYGKNEDAVMPMASTTKIMTCILALESGRLDEIATVSAYAASQPKVHAGLRAGEQYYIRDLLYSMMLESHNDTAVVIAEHIGGSVEGFAEMMNDKARELGMEKTYFITPNGLDAQDENGIHSTTARELAILCAYAIQNEEFLGIIQTPSYQYYDVGGSHSVSASNKDAFLTQMSGALGIKTGYTGGAGYCFAGALENQGRVYVSVVLASGWPPNKNYKWFDTASLMHYGMDHYEYREITVPAVQGSSRITGCIFDETSWLFPSDSMTMLTGDCDTIELITLYPSEISGPVTEEELIGLRRLMINGDCYGVQKLWQPEEIEVRDYRYCLWEIIDQYLL